MSSITPNKPDSQRKKSIHISDKKGVKKDLWIFRMVAQSKGNNLPFTELKNKAKSNSIYQTLDRLSPRVSDVPGKYLFCLDDLAKDHETDEAREKELHKLLRKLEERYNHFLQWHNWKKVKPSIKIKGKEGTKVITIQLDKNNSIILKLIPMGKSDIDKAILTFRKRFEPTEDITKYTGTDSLVGWFALVGMNNNHLPSFKIRKQYVTLRIPLIPKPKQGKLYFKTLSEESYSDLYSQRYLDRVPTDNQIFRMNTKGLLLYALNESDYKELSKSLENLAESDTYQEVKEVVETYDEFGQTTDAALYFNYRIRRDFPFLSYYNDLKRVFPSDFAAEVIKRIATRLNDRIKIFPVQYLRYIMTKLFYKEITEEIQNNNPNNKAFRAFRSEIIAYLGHIEQRALIQGKNRKILSDIEDRRSLLTERLEALIKGCGNRTDNKVIPIYEIIRKARLSWIDISEVLESIATRHEKRYIATDRCLIPRSKTNELKSLLKNEPKYDDACLSLANNGVPMQCISEDLFHKLDNLGFRSTLIKSTSSTAFSSVIRRKEPAQRSKIHVYHDDSRKVTVISVPKK